MRLRFYETLALESCKLGMGLLIVESHLYHFLPLQGLVLPQVGRSTKVRALMGGLSSLPLALEGT